MIERRVKRAIRGSRKMRLEQLVQAMEEPASQDIRGVKLVPILAKAMGKLKDDDLAAAMKTLRAWSRSGSHRRDLDKDGKADDGEAIRIMDAWYPKLVQAQFGPAIGHDAMDELKDMTSFPNVAGDSPAAPAFSDGWWGFVHKDLRDLFDRRRVRGAWSRVYCGKGKRRACRKALRSTFAEALDVSSEELYAHGACADDPDPACWDMNRWTEASAVTVPPMPFQNRPTFQQTVEVTKKLPR
jgi:hypothetical protein